jgi:DNA modification methylase
METRHRVAVADARDMRRVPNDSVELVVTSPPYPMIEMWDDLFADLDPAARVALEDGDGDAAFDAMHAVLDDVWDEVARVLVDGGVACVNVGDATRSVDGSFRVYQNHARVTRAFEDRGFDPLPDVVWRKPTNSGTKFMGSGMLPPNAYVTLEHEHVLVFRNGDTRSFERRADRRYESAYFWEERNRWFSDVWRDLPGEPQDLADADLRDRSGAYPLELPYRLVNMYSVYGDTVLDPFWGTGTTTLAAMVAGRDSVGYERTPEFADAFEARVDSVREHARERVRERVRRHREFVREERADGETFEYEADHYDFPVRTQQEQGIRFYEASDVEPVGDGYVAAYEPFEGA